MKLKPNQTRTYDGEGFKKRAACLCFKNEREEEVRSRSVTLCVYVTGPYEQCTGGMHDFVAYSSPICTQSFKQHSGVNG